MEDIGVKSKIEADQLFKFSKMKEVIKPTRPHRHDNYFEIVILTEGSGIHTINTEDYPVIPPAVYFLRPGQVHCWHFTRIPKGYVILFKEKFLVNYPATSYLLHDLPALLHPQTSLAPLCEESFAAYRKNSSPELLQAYLNLLLWQLKSDVAESQQVPSAYLTITTTFQKLIDQNFALWRNIDPYTEQMQISAYRLNQACQQLYSKNASEMIREKLVAEAKLLLTHTHKSISEVAYQLAFQDTSNFTKFFKKTTNLTPQQYRSLV